MIFGGLKMRCYVIKRDDGQYLKDYSTHWLIFTRNISEAEFYGNELGASTTIDWIVNKRWLFQIDRRQIGIKEIEIKET